VNSFQFGKDKFDSVCLFVCLFTIWDRLGVYGMLICELFINKTKRGFICGCLDRDMMSVGVDCRDDCRKALLGTLDSVCSCCCCCCG